MPVLFNEKSTDSTDANHFLIYRLLHKDKKVSVAMQSSEHIEDNSSLKSENMGKDTEAKNEQPADFSTEIMSVMEMEQSPDNSPAANSQEETVQDIEIPDTETVKTSDPENSFPADFDKFWKVVETNPQDFTGWVYLLQYVEQEVSNYMFWASG